MGIILRRDRIKLRRCQYFYVYFHTKNHSNSNLNSNEYLIILCVCEKIEHKYLIAFFNELPVIYMYFFNNFSLTTFVVRCRMSSV